MSGLIEITVIDSPVSKSIWFVCWGLWVKPKNNSQIILILVNEIEIWLKIDGPEWIMSFLVSINRPDWPKENRIIKSNIICNR